MAKAPAKAAKPAKARTKSEILNDIAETTELTRKQVAGVFDALTTLIQKDLGKKGPGQFTIPGLVKIRVVNKLATEAYTKEDPFNKGQMMQVKAKPARRDVKVRALKGLKDLV